MGLPIRYTAVVVALYMSGFVSGPTPAQAIPVAGNYEIFGTSGLSGTFTSTGTTASSWNILIE